MDPERWMTCPPAAVRFSRAAFTTRHTRLLSTIRCVPVAPKRMAFHSVFVSFLILIIIKLVALCIYLLTDPAGSN